MTEETEWRLWLRAENLFIFGIALLAYHWLDASWFTFLFLFLLPDLSMLGYAAGKKIGAASYNAAHSYIAPVVWLLIGQIEPFFSPQIALIWVAHIALDRVLGFGIKTTEGFRHTHLGFVGRPPG